MIFTGERDKSVNGRTRRGEQSVERWNGRENVNGLRSGIWEMHAKPGGEVRPLEDVVKGERRWDVTNDEVGGGGAGNWESGRGRARGCQVDERTWLSANEESRA